MGLRLSLGILVVLCSVGSLGCGQDKLDEIISLQVGEDRYRVEVARSPEERQKGLMHREELGEYEGMLFVFERDRHLSFWMKNTEIPLSIAFISSDGTIREIRELEPLSERSVRSSRAVRYALELPRGAFARSGAEPGDTVRFPEHFSP